MRRAELRAGFPWGVLLVSDAHSRDQIPNWETPGDQVTAAATALVVRVMHRDNGEVTVRVWDDASDVRGDVAFSGAVLLPSHVLRISDALGDESVDVDVPYDRVEMEIVTNDPVEASEVHIVVRAAPRAEKIG